MVKYCLDAYALVEPDEAIAHVHDRIFQHLSSHSKMCRGRIIPVAPKIKGGDSLAICDPAKFLPSGMKGYFSYVYRPDAGAPHGGDSAFLKFKADSEFYKDIIEDFIPALIRGMNPYMLTMGDQRFEDPVISSEGMIKVGGPRASGCELYPIFFMADWVLLKKYKITPEAAVAALAPVVTSASLLEGGLYVVGSADVLPYEEAKELVHKIEAQLKAAKPGLFSWCRRLLQGKK
ncbi:hypothetical protein [Prosthecobacter sp.]|uniref:hypothetical protein n=1 Tax=Prosthecobacter sp. TaxID=1965333 RepID=UPI002489CA7F|nr:hypothetical protein [Prosthecobacter sp.]MDI1315276.1 hypothetical protein [Prosthecobacter sp.]